jgi:hypothetical protein
MHMTALEAVSVYLPARVPIEKLAEPLGLTDMQVHNFRLEVELPAPLDKWREWELNLAGEDRDRWKKVRLTYPTELAPCSP